MSGKRQRKFNDHPFAYHEEIEITIDSLSNLGHGVGRVPIPDQENPGETTNWVVFVGFVLPGEKVKVRVFRNSPTYSESDLVEIIEPSPDRIEPVCPLFGDCGGCQYQNATYEAQLKWKRTQVADLLEKHADIDHEVLPVIPSPVQYGYRSKITPHFQKPRDGKVDGIGFLRHGRRQQILDVPHCPIASDSINERLTSLRKEVHANAITYKKGATLLLRDSAEAPGAVCTDMTETCEEAIGDLRFQFPAGEFFQNNPHILPAFVEHAAAEATADPAIENLVDAYCGSGLFALTAAAKFKRVTGIEISEPAIDWAKRNAKLNDIENASFVQGSAEAIFEALDDDYDPAKTAVLIDPPRKGSSDEFLTQLIEFGPARVVYVSCNPATQIRDLAIVRDAYRIEKIQPFDLFPQTRHLECVVTLVKR